MTSSIARLSAAISQSLSAHCTVQAPEPLERFPRLAAAGVDLYERFERAEKALPPPEEKRRAAISKFRNVLPLNASEWRLVFAGLSDKSESVGPILNDDQLYARVHDEVHQRIEERRLSRRDWLALCFSYFGYDAATPAQNANWCLLREDVQLGFECVRDQQKRVKEWVQIVQQHQELFSEQAGATLGDQMFKGEISDLSALQTIAQIPDNSWLWRRIFTVLISRIFMLDDTEFSQRLADLVDIGRQHPRYMNDILSACLSRYHSAAYREKPSSLLKQLALDNWGSPQIRSRQNSWLRYVAEDVCAMVVAWFAKEDLEHFFNLLKGDDDVDQSRLFYWVRFANQMSYTRIIMGSDAWSNEGRDFAHFREKNKGRLGRLIGAAGHNNAVVMQIGNYFFVEFSGKGACYVYQADQSPFNPEKPHLELTTEIKQRHRAVEWMPHVPTPNRPDRVEGWLSKFDGTLGRLGIRVHSQTGAAGSAKPLPFEEQVRDALKSVKHKVYDQRERGGAFQVQLDDHDLAAVTALQRLGFRPVNNQPLRFWRQ
ncbi:type I Zorya anti-phage system protein ZorC [Pseudomonas sp. LAIL14HWK12:I9]|uniref:type I Zorya anti-phage system protein ZorC n=1 Tax=Pseudomonas sp. LAIL14HWK12:I9 TaxID=1259804 RepID=UPI0004853D03|nr:type I Zorya anti-phage system protein ZorC [Pseudomonas sp. LAIL14HWK12:I9]